MNNRPGLTFGGILWSLFFLVLFWAVVYLVSPDLLRELFEYTP